MISQWFETIFWATATELVDLIIPVLVILIIIAIIKKFIIQGN